MGDWLPIIVFGRKSYFQEQITDIKWEMAVFLLISDPGLENAEQFLKMF
jgi:hypothetical protein